MVRNLILGILVVSLCGLALMSCNAGRTPTEPLNNLPPATPQGVWADAWIYPWPTRIHVEWDANTESDLQGYRVYRYSLRHNITDYSTLAISITPYVAGLITQITNETDDAAAFGYFDEIDKTWAQYEDWSIDPKYVYGYRVRAIDIYGSMSDASDPVFAATP